MPRKYQISVEFSQKSKNFLPVIYKGTNSELRIGSEKNYYLINFIYCKKKKKEEKEEFSLESLFLQSLFF